MGPHDGRMPSWSSVLTSAPDLAKQVQRRFDAHGLGLLATLRRDGFPRLSGVEPLFTEEVWVGMMPQSLKALDLLRDPRMTMHSATIDKQVTDGDAKITGLAVAVDDEEALAQARRDFEVHTGQAPPPGPMHLFRIDVRELAFVHPEHDRLVIESWSAARGIRRIERT
jgi:hypothetical protein